MKSNDKAKFYLYDLTVPDPDIIQETDWLQVASLMEKSDWMGDKGTRFGFVEVAYDKEIMGGVFAHEGRKTGIQYTDDKQQVETDAFHSFEHLYFAIFLDTSQILLQQRNIYGYRDLGLPLMKENFRLALTTLLRYVGKHIPGDTIWLESSGQTYSQEEMYNFFLENSVVHLEVSELSPLKIPKKGEAGYKLYNPKEELIETSWLILDDSLQVGLGHISMRAKDDGISDISKGPIPKAFAAAGDIQEVAVRRSNGNIIVRKKERDEEISVEIPSEPKVAERLLKIVLAQLDENHRKKEWENRKRKRAKLNGPFFEND